MTIRNLDALLAPRSLALVGASEREGSLGKVVLARLEAGGFSGPIGLVNPKHDTIAGRPCVPSVEALADPPELAIIMTPPKAIPPIIDALGTKGARAAIVITAGLSIAEKAAMLNAARPHLLRILGPNCLGLQVPPIGLDASFSNRIAAPGNLALLSQSGAIVTAMVDWAADRRIGFSVVASMGEMADVDVGDLVDYIAADPATDAILMYLEAVTDAPKFLSACRLAAASKPLIVLKAGRSETASRAAASHTGALAGVDAVYDAAFARAGIVRVDDLGDLFGAAETLSRFAGFSGERLGILTNGGGAGVLATDAMSAAGTPLAPLSPHTIAALDKKLPANWSRANPIDIIGDASPTRYADAVRHVLADDTVDALLVLNCPTGLASSEAAATAVATTVKESDTTKPVLAAWLGGPAARASEAPLEDARIPAFSTPREAVHAYGHLVRHARTQRLLLRVPPAEPENTPPDREKARTIIAAARAENRTLLNEVEAKNLLAAYKIPTVPSEVAANASAAADIARRLLRSGAEGVAVKILSPDISHKSDVGGVRLNLSSPHEVRQATDAMIARAREVRPEAAIRGVVVQPMVRRPDAYELILGLSDDVIFGPTILFGAGGTSVEVVADRALALPPLDRVLAADLIAGTRVARLLEGYRDRPPVALVAIEDALIRLSHLAADFPEVAELDINPLLADPTGVIALDARVKLTREPVTGRLAIRPYPAALARTVPYNGGTVHIRPVRPADAALFPGFLDDTAPEERRALFATFFSFEEEEIARFTHIDYARAMAFGAIADGALVGVARLQTDPDGLRADIALLVRQRLRGTGLGHRLAETLIDYADGEGIERLAAKAVSPALTDVLTALGFSAGAAHLTRERPAAKGAG
ncbi:MAG: bifunctional acetate--CoA ligase family protein/GNAT family N-acetyltransferase [Pseudomonadota bacterium]